jgi:hypothetical protein
MTSTAPQLRLRITTQVEERAGDGGDRKAVHLRDVSAWQRARLDDAPDHCPVIVPARGEHLDHAGSAVSIEAVQPRSGAQAKHGVASCEIQGRLALRPVVEGMVPQPVDTSPDRDENPAASQRGARMRGDPGRPRQLGRNDSMPSRPHGRHYILISTHMLFQ